MRSYIALIHKDADSDYGVSFPDVPGCIAAGSTLDEARDLAAEALAFHFNGLMEDGSELPEPSTLEDIMAYRENRDAVAILVDWPSQHDRSAGVVRTPALQPERLTLLDDSDISSPLGASACPPTTTSARRPARRSPW